MLGQCFLLQCQAIATRCEHGGGAVKGGLLQDTWKDTWKPFYQLIQGILCQLIPKLLSNIELDTAGEGGGVGLFEDMTALVVVSVCRNEHKQSSTSEQHRRSTCDQSIRA